MKITLVVSTYNSPRYLRLVLEGIARQTASDWECIVADDGSTAETASVIAEFTGRIPVIHSWHEDSGFRLAAARNRAASLASGDVFVFLDGDCIPAPEYLDDVERTFSRLRRMGIRAFVQGHRVILGEGISREIETVEEVFSMKWLLKHRREIGNFKNGIRIPQILWPNRRERSIRGCSMAFEAGDFLKINGFDEEFVGWGHEDKDIALRLFRSGVRRVDARGEMIVYHLYHPESGREESELNLARARESRLITAARGVVRRVNG